MQSSILENQAYSHHKLHSIQKTRDADCTWLVIEFFRKVGDGPGRTCQDTFGTDGTVLDHQFWGRIRPLTDCL